ncbi:hypothetical protein INR49_000522, partial [Caranx melampygus]
MSQTFIFVLSHHSDPCGLFNMFVNLAGILHNKCLSSVLSEGWTVLFITVFPVVHITIGAVYLHECPVAPVIPVYVLVCGILALLLMGLLVLPELLCPAAPGNRMWTACILSLVLFASIWFLCGSYQVYSVYPPNYNKNITIQDTVNTTIYPPTAPDNRFDLTLKNQSLLNLNHTGIISSKQHTFRQLNQNLVREHLNAPRPQLVSTVVPYCDRTVYLFAFWTTTRVYMPVGNALVMFISEEVSTGVEVECLLSSRQRMQRAALGLELCSPVVLSVLAMLRCSARGPGPAAGPVPEVPVQLPLLPGSLPLSEVVELETHSDEQLKQGQGPQQPVAAPDGPVITPRLRAPWPCRCLPPNNTTDALLPTLQLILQAHQDLVQQVRQEGMAKDEETASGPTRDSSFSGIYLDDADILFT